MVEVNYMSVVLAAVVSIVVGAIWWGPLFSKQWLALSGATSETMATGKKGMGVAYTIQAVGSLVMAFILSHVIVFATSYMHTSGWLAGVSAGFWMWLGFVAPILLGSVLWERKPWKLWAINAGGYLVSFVLMGAVIAGMM